MIRLAIVDDHALSREGLRAILSEEEDIEVVGTLSDGVGAATYAASERLDVLLMDIAMPGMDGIAAARETRELAPDTAVIMLTTLPDEESIRAALRAGAHGYLLKTCSADELVAAVRDAHRGRRSFAPAILDRLASEFAGQGSGDEVDFTKLAEDTVPVELAELTERELEVFREIGRGRSNAEISETLFLTEKTVKTYVTRILNKLGLASRVQAVVLAFETGFVTGEHD